MSENQDLQCKAKMDDLQYNRILTYFYQKVVQPKRMERDYVYFMLMTRDRESHHEQMCCLACIILETLRIDPDHPTDPVAKCMRKVVSPKLSEHPNAKRINPEDTTQAASTSMQKSILSWRNVALAIDSYLNNIGEWETSQSIKLEYRIKDAQDALLFSALVLCRPFFEWFQKADDSSVDIKDRNPNSPTIYHKERFISFARNNLPLLLENLMNGTQSRMSGIDEYVSKCRSMYITIVGVYHPDDDLMKKYDPVPELLQ